MGQPPLPRPAHPVPSSPGPSSAFRHIEGVVLPRTTHITNLRGLSLTTPGECDGFCANRHRIAIPLLATGGQVAILEVKHHPHPQGHVQWSWPAAGCGGGGGLPLSWQTTRRNG